MSVETQDGVGLFSPEVQRAISKEDVEVIIVPEIYTFWQQSRPGVIFCPVDKTVVQEIGIIFFSDYETLPLNYWNY